MASYTVLRQQSPSAMFPFCQPGFLFNTVEHLQQQTQGAFHVITALNQTTQRTDARCAFFPDQDTAASPSAAPFGSVEFAQTLPDAVLSEVIEALIDEARSTGSQTLQLVNYPHCYAPQQAERLTCQLIEHGFEVTESNLNAHIPVADDPFNRNLSLSERRRLQKCRRAGFHFGHLVNPNPETVAAFVTDVRCQQQYQTTLSTDKLIHLLCRFPNEFPVFVVKDGPAIIALTVTVRVRADILYTFLPASQPGYHAFSPMVMLTDGLFTYCRQQNIRLLDLGVSLDGDRQLKPSLLQFKRNLGAQTSLKLIFSKQL